MWFVKNKVNKTFENFNLTNVSWITSYSRAEESGPSAGSKDLFKNRWTIICEGKTQKRKS